MLENKMYEGILYSRFLASWIHEGGSNDWRFGEWLRSLIINGKNIPEKIVNEILEFNYYFVGKMELEHDAKKFLQEKNYMMIGNRPYLNHYRI